MDDAGTHQQDGGAEDTEHVFYNVPIPPGVTLVYANVVLSGTTTYTSAGNAAFGDSDAGTTSAGDIGIGDGVININQTATYLIMAGAAISEIVDEAPGTNPPTQDFQISILRNASLLGSYGNGHFHSNTSPSSVNYPFVGSVTVDGTPYSVTMPQIFGNAPGFAGICEIAELTAGDTISLETEALGSPGWQVISGYIIVWQIG